MNENNGYKDIEDYGIIGNLETCALVGRDGAIDWLCLPFLESASVFAAVLDAKRGGLFRISPSIEYESVQAYIRYTNILQTRFISALGEVTITDFMPIRPKGDDAFVISLFRKVSCIKGKMPLEVVFEPRFDYARATTTFAGIKNGIVAQGKREELFLQSPLELNIEDERPRAEFTLDEGQVRWFVLNYGSRRHVDEDGCEELLERVKKHWLGWAKNSLHTKIGKDQPWQDIVIRSGLILKLLTTPDTGSIAAAATTSLPEEIGGVRNWDYRYAWIRDASFTSQALFHLGHVKESADFRRWIWSIIEDCRDPSNIKIMYGLHSEKDIEEKTLDNLCGYKNSSPVRIGNGAAGQKQLDIFGELINMVYETSRYGEEITHKRWQDITTIVEYVCSVWDSEDCGIWEVRGGKRHFVYSKLMCWVALDRAIKIAKAKGFSASLDKWQEESEKIRQAILEKGFNKKLNSFVQSFGSQELDATGLLIPLMGFLPASDERVKGTIEAIKEKLTSDGHLVYRYQTEDGLPGAEGHFILCSFWLIKALVLSGSYGQAEKIFLNVIKYISPLGIFAEEIDSKTKRQLGNFPQAFSHIGLINSALYLGMALGKLPQDTKLMGVS